MSRSCILFTLLFPSQAICGFYVLAGFYVLGPLCSRVNPGVVMGGEVASWLVDPSPADRVMLNLGKNTTLGSLLLFLLKTIPGKERKITRFFSYKNVCPLCSRVNLVLCLY